MSVKQAIPPTMIIVGSINLIAGHLGSIELRITGAFIALTGVVLWATFRVLDGLKRIEREQHQAQQIREAERILARPTRQRPRHAPPRERHLHSIKALLVAVPSSLLAWTLARARDNTVPMTLAASMVAATPLMAPVLHTPDNGAPEQVGDRPEPAINPEMVVNDPSEPMSHTFTPTPEPTSGSESSPEPTPEPESATGHPTAAPTASEPTTAPTPATPTPTPDAERTVTSTPDPEPTQPGGGDQNEPESGGPTQRPDHAGEPGSPTEPPGQDKKSGESGDLDRGNGRGQDGGQRSQVALDVVVGEMAVDVHGGLDALVAEASLDSR